MSEILYLMGSTGLGILVVSLCSVLALDWREKRGAKRRVER